MKFNVVVANPPFSLDKWGQEMAAEDRYRPLPARHPAQEQGRLGLHQPHGRRRHVEGTGRVGGGGPPRRAVPGRPGRQDPSEAVIRGKSARRRDRPAGQPLLRHRHSGRPDDLRSKPRKARQARRRTCFSSMPAANSSRAPTRTTSSASTSKRSWRPVESGRMSTSTPTSPLFKEIRGKRLQPEYPPLRGHVRGRGGDRHRCRAEGDRTDGSRAGRDAGEDGAEAQGDWAL